MTKGIKLVRLSTQDVGPLVGRVDLGPFADGINVISGRNEAGKSTLVEALRAALFERYDANNQKIRALQTRGTRNAPEIWVELEIGRERVSVHKRFIEKPSVEVRLHHEGTVVYGAEAEDLLLAQLEGRRPGKRGGTRNDMGLWGLLWVSQDESAYTDPGDALDEHVRGVLSEIIGRQVGQVLGGKHGERVRARVLEEVARYTDKHGAKTGVLRAAEEKRKKANDRLREIEQKKKAVEGLAEEHQTLSEQLREAELRLPELEREHASAVAAEHRVRELEGTAREAASHAARAEAMLQSVQQQVEARASLTCEEEQLRAEIQKGEETENALKLAVERARMEAAASRDVADRAKEGARSARAAMYAARDRLDRARRRVEAARAAEAWRAAEEVARSLAEGERFLEAEAIDERALEQLEHLAMKAASQRARLDAEGTRIVVFPSDGEAIVRSVGGPATIDVPGLGVLAIEPARPGLAQALAEADKQRTKLEETLLALGVADMKEARERHAARVELEREQEALGSRMSKLAPQGLDVLEREVSKSRAESARLESALDEAVRAEQEREESLRHLAAHRIGEASMDALRQKERDVAVLRAACDAIGTRVEIRALADLRCRIAGEAEPSNLKAGDRRSLTSTRRTTVIVDEVAEITLDPRGKDLAEARAQLERAERDLATTLQTLGVSSVAEAAERARAWARLDATRRQAEERLAEAAPYGLGVLRAAVERARAQCRAAEATLADAKAVCARHAQIEIALSQNRVTRDALARLIAFERELSVAEAAVERLQAHVRAVAGPVAEGPQRAWAVSRAVRPGAVQGIEWEIIPGELGSGIDVDGIERRLREALERVGVPDLDTAKARFVARVAMDAQVAELRKQLERLAPDGLDALRARAAAFDGAEAAHAAAAGDEEDEDLAVLQRAVDARCEELRALEASAERAADDANRAEHELRGLESALREAAAVRHEKCARLERVREKLAAQRAAEPDEDLWQRHHAARWEHEQALARARRATADLEEAAPQLLRGEVLRAKGAIDSHQKRIADLREQLAGRKALLEKAAVEGRFEDLCEARVAALEADEEFKRIEREARAARLLCKVVEEAYAESQRLFVAPVSKEAEPYLAKLRPGTKIKMTQDFKVDKVVRCGIKEDFGQLSGGTREQLSVIVRLSLARVMARDKRPLPLILDDTMGWTDDGRFLSMVQILRDAASELQIILLTCHAARFDRFQAEYSVDLDRLRAPRPPAPEVLVEGAIS